MKAFAYTEPIGISDVVFKVITEDGDLFCENWKYFSTKAKDAVMKKYLDLLYDIEWVSSPFKHDGINNAKKKYELTIGIRYDCKQY